MQYPPQCCESLLPPSNDLLIHGIGIRGQRNGRHRIIPPVDTKQPLLSMLFNYEEVAVFVNGREMRFEPMSFAIWNNEVIADYGATGSEYHISWLQAWGKEILEIASALNIKFNAPHKMQDEHIVQLYFEGILEELLRYKRPDKGIVLSLLRGLLQEFNRAGQPFELRVKATQSLLEMKKHIDSHYQEPEAIKLGKLAKRAGMSSFHFCRKFKKSFGLSPFEYAMNLRLAEVVARMVDPSMNLSEIARKSGFSDMANFSKTFKRHFSLSPSDYRKRMFS